MYCMNSYADVEKLIDVYDIIIITIETGSVNNYILINKNNSKTIDVIIKKKEKP